ncbi:uncharacterized methyltransferase MJ1487 [Candidatus Vecturithrix granuli]|uniref:Uncharacterized methyltransferase MJ1487 n=1 Tax=Vecturithrix granuli TaxID=1499967 RepID=A0A0S6W9F2_VECG1|nr:uncharacterized methyltransferase MJ1487 [Candidatus Vecturithrix granuli]
MLGRCLMSDHAIIFVECDYNRYSLAVLTGILEEDERFENLDLHFLKFRKRMRSAHSNALHVAEQVAELVRRYHKLVLAFSFHTANVMAIGELIRDIRHKLAAHHIEHVLFVAGGPHPSGDPEGTLRLGIDVIVIGEGEATFPCLLDAYFHDKDYRLVEGVGFLRDDGHFQANVRPSPVDLSDFPPFALWHKRFCPMEISRGCPWGCYYCQTPFLMGACMRHRSLESIITYAERAKRLRCNLLRFITPNAFAYGAADGRSVNLEALEAMLKAVSGIYGKEQVYLGSFPSEVRPEHISAETIALIKAYCANDNLVIGAQSGSDRLLEAIHRGHGVAEILRATELTLNAGLIPNVDLIFGLPGEIQQDREATLQLITRLIAMGARIHSHVFMPLAGTPFFKSRPGSVDAHTRYIIEQLRGKQLEHGNWKQHERIARETADFLTLQKAGY